MTTCTFVGNDAGRSGGGLACVADPDHLYPSNADVLDVTFEFNHADEEGGGIHVRYSDPILEAVDVTENIAGNTGGGINFFDSPLSQLLGSTICANTPNQTEGAFTDGGNNSINDTCSSCLGDVNEDGDVNVTDILAIINAWTTSDPDADVNGDGVVNVTDLLLVVSAWGAC